MKAGKNTYEVDPILLSLILFAVVPYDFNLERKKGAARHGAARSAYETNTLRILSMIILDKRTIRFLRCLVTGNELYLAILSSLRFSSSLLLRMITSLVYSISYISISKFSGRACNRGLVYLNYISPVIPLHKKR